MAGKALRWMQLSALSLDMVLRDTSLEYDDGCPGLVGLCVMRGWTG